MKKWMMSLALAWPAMALAADPALPPPAPAAAPQAQARPAAKRVMAGRWGIGLDSVPGATPASVLGGVLSAPNAVAVRYWFTDKLAADGLLAMASAGGELRLWRPGQCPTPTHDVARVRPTAVTFDGRGRLVAVEPDALRRFALPEGPTPGLCGGTSWEALEPLPLPGGRRDPAPSALARSASTGTGDFWMTRAVVLPSRMSSALRGPCEAITIRSIA